VRAGRRGSRVRHQDPNPRDLGGLLRSSGEQRSEETNGEASEPDPPHGHLGGGWLAGSLADECCPENLAVWVEHALLDHLVRPEQDGLRDGQPERLGGLHVDH